MGWDILLSASLQAIIGVLPQAGFGEEARNIKNKWTNTKEKTKKKALDAALEKAIRAKAVCLSPFLP